MKRLLLITLFLNIAFAQVKYAESRVGGFFPKEQGSHISYYEYGKYNEILLSFYYYDNNSSDIRVKYHTYGTFSFNLSKDERTILIKYFEKYIEWENKATKAGLELNKRIEIKVNDPNNNYFGTEKATLHSLNINPTTVSVTTLASFIEYGVLQSDRDIYIKFFSQNKKRHHIILDFSLLEDKKFAELENKRDQISLKDYKTNFRFYLDLKQAVDFKNFISEDYINSKKVVFN